MPAQPAWFHRLDEILETLRGMESTHLDRLAVQKLFGVRERRARQLMAGLPGLRAGNAFAASRLAFIARLEETAAGGLFQWETNRRARIVEDLDRTRRQLAARRARAPPPGAAGPHPGRGRRTAHPRGGPGRPHGAEARRAADRVLWSWGPGGQAFRAL